MKSSMDVQILDYPGAQKSALWGMRDLLEFANAQASAFGTSLFSSEIAQLPDAGSNVVVLPPALSLEPPVLQPEWRERLLALHKDGTVLCSVCSGAFLLAGTGLLDGRRVTTHWRHAEAFRETCPKAIIETDRLLVDLGDIVTAGGVMAWTDLTLHLIQRFAGRKLMIDVARMFVLDPPDREQSYYASFQPNTNHSDAQIVAAQNLLQRELSMRHSVASLAEATLMSERSFLRRFKKATGMSPVTYLQLLRIETARSRLELTLDSFERISWEVGYSDAAAFRRVFKRTVGLTPTDYRRRFGLKPDPSRAQGG
jgi:transcriptional regulator GlxA family with amidase domain